MRLLVGVKQKVKGDTVKYLVLTAIRLEHQSRWSADLIWSASS